MKYTTTSSALALVLALGAAPAFAAAEWTFDDIDADGDLELTNAEFEQISLSVFRSWDADADQRLSDEEIYGGILVSWDGDQDGSLTEQEYRDGAGVWFARGGVPAFSDLDRDGDDAVTRDEFAAGMSEAGALDTGADGMQYQDFHAALFALYDTGGTGAIDRDDYAAMSDSRMVGGPATVALTQAEPGTGSALTAGEDGADGTEYTAGDTRTREPAGGVSAMSSTGVGEMSAVGVGADGAADEDVTAVAQVDDAAGMDVDATGTAAIGSRTIRPEEVVALSEWNADDLYVNGLSVDDMIDDAEVYGQTGDEIGSIENVVFSNDGRVLSIVAEVGGFWDLFDTHVNIPWDQVTLGADGRVTIPVTEENVEDYSTWKTGYLAGPEAAEGVEVVDDDLETGPTLFRATDLIGAYARLRDGETGQADAAAGGYRNYGYVNDLIIRDGQLQAVVVSPDDGYGLGRGAYPYPYYGWGWNARRPYYDMPYGRGDVAESRPLDYERFEYAE
jgi:hypothetical protein